MSRLRTLGFTVIVLAVVSDSLAQVTRVEGPPQTRQMNVNGVDLFYIDQGTGAPVVFVHGAFSDLRFWESQRQAIAQKYRFIAYTQRYHGTAAWPDEGKNYSAATHATDLAGFIRQLNAGPVHLVGISYGGFLATVVATKHPELLRALIVAEPTIEALLTDNPEAKPLLDDRRKARAPVRAAVKAGDAVQAAKLLFDSVNNRGAGAFDKQPEAIRQMILENARTVPLLMAGPPRLPVSCATLGGMKIPTLITRGEQTQRFYSLISEVAARCVRGSRLVTIPNATHPMSIQNPAVFNEVLLQFLAQH